MFNSSEVKSEKQFVGKYINVGIQDLKINSIEVKTSAAGDKKQVTFNVEGPEVKDLGFEAVEGAKGPVGRVKTMYLSSEGQKAITAMFARIADAIGTREELNKVNAATLEEYVEAANKILTGKFAKFNVGGEEYINPKQKISVNLHFIVNYKAEIFNFVESLGMVTSKLKFDPTNTFHYKKAVQPDNIVNGTVGGNSDMSDLPF